MIKIFYTLSHRYSRRKILSNERGATLIEVMGVIAILGALVTGIWKLVNGAMYKYKLSEATVQIQSLAKNLSRFYAAIGNYDDLNESDTISKLFENLVVPREMRVGSSTIKHSFFGDVTLSGHGETFSIVFTKLPKNSCAELATLSWQKTDRTNLVSIKIGSDLYEWPGALNVSTGEEEEGVAAAEKKVLPVSMGDAMASCSVSDGDLNNIEWTFR